MSWNGSGGNKQDDPWNKNQDPQFPDIHQVLIKLINKWRSILGFKKHKNTPSDPQLPSSSHFGLVFIVVILIILWGLSGFYIVNPAEKAVVLRFGKYVEVSSPGLHWIARFIETKHLVDIQKIYSFSLDGDFLTKSSDQNDLPAQSVQIAPEASSNMNDLSKNLVNVELNVQYRVSDPRAYLFNVVSPNETVQQVAAGSLSAAIGQMKLDDVLTTGREFLSSKVFEATKQVLSTYNAGVEVVAVTLRKAQAPDQVRAAFNDVNRADQDKATYIQQAQAYASKIIPLAQGMAARALADATGYQQKVVLTAQANIASYQALLNVYASSPDVTRDRMYLETIQTVLSRTTKVLVDVNGCNNLLYLPLDKLLRQRQPLNQASIDNVPTQNTEAMQDGGLHGTSGEVTNEIN
ncbi:MAG: FtsH protease activity modulator HflK [Gammaproteobacteria bacterium]|nr:FtsH protease activity modulator HflK [Gammaproteobacteria bacterium]